MRWARTVHDLTRFMAAAAHRSIRSESTLLKPWWRRLVPQEHRQIRHICQELYNFRGTSIKTPNEKLKKSFRKTNRESDKGGGKGHKICCRLDYLKAEKHMLKEGKKEKEKESIELWVQVETPTTIPYTWGGNYPIKKYRF